MNRMPKTLPTSAELAEIEQLDAILIRLSRRADTGPRSLAHAALAARFSATHAH